MTKLVIIGTGLAGYTLAREFRKRDSEAKITLISQDDGSSYSKPMLSNALDKGKTAETLVMASAAKMAETLNADILTHTQVTAISPDKQVLETDKDKIAFDKLVIATGANPIRIPIEGDAADQVLSVNNLEDYHHFRQALEKGNRVVIIGAGLIGCEFANDLSTLDAETHVVDLAPRALGRLLPEQAAATLQQKLTDIGTHWHLDTSIASIEQSADGLKVSLKNGDTIMADVVLSAVGLRANTQLASDAGLTTARGIQVNRLLQSSHPNIYALGDCAEVEGLNLPYVMPLMASARALAATLAGEETRVSYPAMPVVVKTPCYPTVVCPPVRPTEGSWEEQLTENGIRALFKDEQGQLAGFALTGDAVKEKMTLAKELSDWL